LEGFDPKHPVRRICIYISAASVYQIAGEVEKFAKLSNKPRSIVIHVPVKDYSIHILNAGT
jgi:hypothetical protein